MSDSVQFDEDNVGMPRVRPGQTAPRSFSSANYVQASASKGLTGLLVRYGLISSDSGAKVVLVSVVAINFLASALIIYFFVLR